MVEPFRVTSGDMSGDAFVESELGKKTESSGQMLFSMKPLFGR